MDFIEKFSCVLKEYNEIIIYGYRDIGMCVLDFIIQYDTNIRTSNYSGKVKFFATSYKTENDVEKKGIKIRAIEELTEYKDSALVIIATRERFHDAIREKLLENGFYNLFFILYEQYVILKTYVKNRKDVIDHRVAQYSLMHEQKLNRLREKIRKGEKAKVFFLTQRPAAFGCESVYRAMEKSEYFDPYILCFSKRDIFYPGFLEDVKQDVGFFQKKGMKAICGYDAYSNPVDLNILTPDIIFFDSPNLYGPSNNSHFRLDLLNWRFLTCYIPYGLLMVDSFYYHYDNINVRQAWKHFIDTPISYKRMLSDSEFNGMNMVCAGYPKFDDYYNEHINVPSKIDNGKPIVIYAPHWTLAKENNFSTFDLYKDFIFAFMEEHTEINFVFKPHPELYFRIKALYRTGGIPFSEKDYEQYMDEWNNLPNGICITEGDYIGLFRKSACMITDCGSFIGEYLPSLNPCIYIFNPRKKNQEDAYTSLAKRILDTYYVVNTEEELDRKMRDIILDKSDPKKGKRENVLKNEFGNIGKAGEFIVNYLEESIIS